MIRSLEKSPERNSEFQSQGLFVSTNGWGVFDLVADEKFKIRWPGESRFFCGREKWIEKNFNFKINHDQSTAGDMHFNFTTKTRRKPFLEFSEFFRISKIFYELRKKWASEHFFPKQRTFNEQFIWIEWSYENACIHVCSHVYMYFNYYM